jgi:hypothetical protein
VQTTIVHYQKCDFPELFWLKRLLRGRAFEQVQDLSQTKVFPDSIVICKKLGQLRPELLQSIFVTPGVVLFHISDEWYLDRLEPYRCFAHVIRSYYHPVLNRQGVTQIPLGPSRFLNADQEIKPAADRRFIWSFAGNLSSTRRTLVQTLTGVVPNHVHITGSRGQSNTWLGPEEYLKLLGDSVFVPCPMGNVNLDSFRLYEALDCGAIPIVERRPWLDYFTDLFGPHPLPSVNNWTQARSLVNSLVSDPVRLKDKQVEIQNWWRHTEAQFSNQIESALSSATGRNDRINFASGVPARLRGFCEMLKHHNGPALLARSQLTLRRLFMHQS